MTLPDRRPAPHVPAARPAWAAPFTRPDVRVGDTERTIVVEQLSEHYSLGRLTHDELAARAQVAMNARTRGELLRVVSDLPALRQAKPVAPLALIVAAIVTTAVLVPVAGVMGVVTLFMIGSGSWLSWLVSFLVTAALAAGAGLYARRGLRARRDARDNPFS